MTSLAHIASDFTLGEHVFILTIWKNFLKSSVLPRRTARARCDNWATLVVRVFWNFIGHGGGDVPVK